MIFGDPYRFAVLIQHLPEWSDDTYKNGLFHFCIDGFFFPEEIRTSTLWVDVLSLKDNTNALFSFQENKVLFEKGTKDAFNFMLGMISPELIGQDEPENFEQSYQYQASTENINDAGFIVFAVSHGDMVRILGAKYSELKQDEH
ncbi:immunity 42 family protein, partial [Photorhabdus sp. CRCIA-P01]